LPCVGGSTPPLGTNFLTHFPSESHECGKRKT